MKRIVNMLRNFYWIFTVSLYLSKKGVKYGKLRAIRGRPCIQRHHESQIEIGVDAELISDQRTNILGINHPVMIGTRKKGARIQIGNHVGMSGSSIVADKEIIIGDNVLLGANSTIVDTDFHPLGIVNRRYSIECDALPVHIGNNVFIGMNAIVLKGVTVGDFAVIGAGAIVVKDVPEKAVVVGNPARVVKYIE